MYDLESISLAGIKDKLLISKIYCKKGPDIYFNLYLSQNSFYHMILSLLGFLFLVFGFGKSSFYSVFFRRELACINIHI